MRRIGVAVDPPLGSPIALARNDGKGRSLPVILPVSGGASAPKQARRGRAGQEEERRPTKQKRPAPGLPGAGLGTCEGKRPLLAGGVLLSHGLHRSTIGARGLNFRVRDGTGCASPAMAAGQQGAFSSAGPPVRALRAAQRSKAPPGPGPRPHALPAPAGGGNRVRARTISTARLSGSPHLRLRPIQQVVCLCPYQKEDSSREGLPA